MKKIKKSSGRRLDATVASLLRKEVRQLYKELASEFDEKIKQTTDGIRVEFSSVFASLASSIANGKLDARGLANSAARSIAPFLKDYLNKSLSQQGDDLLASISKARRNT